MKPEIFIIDYELNFISPKSSLSKETQNKVKNWMKELSKHPKILLVDAAHLYKTGKIRYI